MWLPQSCTQSSWLGLADLVDFSLRVGFLKAHILGTRKAMGIKDNSFLDLANIFTLPVSKEEGGEERKEEEEEEGRGEEGREEGEEEGEEEEPVVNQTEIDVKSNSNYRSYQPTETNL